jgi:hypothetical protein
MNRTPDTTKVAHKKTLQQPREQVLTRWEWSRA